MRTKQLLESQDTFNWHQANLVEIEVHEIQPQFALVARGDPANLGSPRYNYYRGIVSFCGVTCEVVTPLNVLDLRIDSHLNMVCDDAYESNHPSQT